MGKGNLIPTTSTGETTAQDRNTTARAAVVDPIQMWVHARSGTYCNSSDGWTLWRNGWRGADYPYYAVSYGWRYQYRWCDSAGCHDELRTLAPESIGVHAAPAHVGANAHFYVAYGLAEHSTNPDGVWVYGYPGAVPYPARGREQDMSTGGFSKARLGRMHDVMARHVEQGNAPGIVTAVRGPHRARELQDALHGEEVLGAQLPDDGRQGLGRGRHRGGGLGGGGGGDLVLSAGSGGVLLLRVAAGEVGQPHYPWEPASPWRSDRAWFETYLSLRAEPPPRGG